MEHRFCRILLAGVLLFSPLMSQADELQRLGVDAKIERREIDEAMIDSENFELGVSMGIISIEDFGSNRSQVCRLAYHISEDFFAEVAYGKSEGQLSSAEQEFSTRKMTDDERQYRYYNVSLGYNILPGEAFLLSGRAFNSALYLIAGSGVTSFAGDEFFTINYGVGYRLLVNDWLALRMDSRDHVYSSDLAGEQKSNHNLEMLFGMTVFF